jgi:hypothetical protein
MGMKKRGKGPVGVKNPGKGAAGTTFKDAIYKKVSSK